MARKVIYSMASSADGFIARPDRSVDFLHRPRPKHMYGMREFYGSIDTCLMGRKTYDFAVGHGMRDAYPGKKNFVFSRTLKKVASSKVSLVHEHPAAVVRRLRAEKGKHIWVVSGSVAGALLDESELDEIIVNIIPVYIGEGVPLFAARHRSVPLRLVATKKFFDGVVMLHYRVKR